MQGIDKKKGYILLLTSTTLLYFMTVFVKLITNLGNIPGTEVSFFRFLIGFVMVNIGMMKNGYEIKMINRKAVLLRAVFASLSIISFFIVIEILSATKANIYNLSYPIFVALLAPLFLKDEHWSLKNILGVVISFSGLLLISGLAFGAFTSGDVAGILMGMISGLGIIALREARKTDNANTILFYMFFTGLVITALCFGKTFKMPNTLEWIYIAGMGIFSYLGQYTMACGFKHVTSVEGSLISESRIFIAAIFGVLFMGETLTASTLFGGFLIFVGIVVVSVKGIGLPKKASLKSVSK